MELGEGSLSQKREGNSSEREKVKVVKVHAGVGSEFPGNTTAGTFVGPKQRGKNNHAG